MLVLIRTFFDITLRRKGPEDLPASAFLLAVTVLLSIAVQVPLTWIIFGSGGPILPTLAIDLGLLVLCLWLLLRLTGFASRFGQTLTALLGTSALLNVVSLPFTIWNSSLPAAQPKPLIPSAVILALVLWSFFVDAHILARALSTSIFVGLLITIGYFFLHTTVLVEFVPGLQ